MRSKTENEKAFNAVAKGYGIPGATATQFHNAEKKHPALHHAFTSFTADPIPLESSLLEQTGIIGANEKPKYYDIFEDKSGISQQEANETGLTAQLFKLHTQIPEISCHIYADTEMYGFYPDSKGEESYDVAKKIEEWHYIRTVIDKIKPFLENRYPRYDKADKAEKSIYKNEIKMLIEELEVLGSDTRELNIVHDFLQKNIALNSINIFKRNILLEFNFPLIDSLKIATKVVNSSLP